MSSSAAAMFGEEPHDSRGGRGNALCFPAAFYGKSFMEMDAAKGAKSDAFEGKRRKGTLMRNFGFSFLPVWVRESKAHSLGLFKMQESQTVKCFKILQTKIKQTV